MKLLDPFAGYRLASGHPIFHIALFIGSFMISAFGEDGWDANASIKEAFNILRWGHFLLFTLAAVEFWCNRPSAIDKLEDDDNEAQVVEDSFGFLKVVHRDGSWKLFARVCATLSVFAYQGSVFFAQLVLANELMSCCADGWCTGPDGQADVDAGDSPDCLNPIEMPNEFTVCNTTASEACWFTPIHGNKTVWLLLETSVFYLYILSTVAYIVWRQCAGIFHSAELISDMAKAVNDFIEYAELNLTWFAFNIVLIFMPVMCIMVQNPMLVKAGEDASYLPIMLTLMSVNILVFLFKMRIYKIEELQAAQPGESIDANKGLDDKDDDFKLQNKEGKIGDANKNMLASEKVKTIKFEDHYHQMQRVFDTEHSWIWILNGLTVVSCFVAYLVIDGKEIVFALYIPLDLYFQIGKAVFYWGYYWIDHSKKTQSRRLAKYIENRQVDADERTASNQEALLHAPDRDSNSQNSSQKFSAVSAFGAQSAVMAKYENKEAMADLKKAKAHLKDVVNADSVLGLGGDTYAMAFKAFNWQVIRQLDLNINEVHNSFHAAMFVFGIQCLMIFFIATMIFSDSFAIVLPSTLSVMGARFICTILMHLQVEGDMRQGLRMMKFVTNHPKDFANPGSAFFVALMQCIGGLFAEIACILFLGSIDKAIDVIIKFVALASIAKVDDFYASALPADGNKIKKKTDPLKITVHKRDWTRQDRIEDEAEAAGKDADESQILHSNMNHKVGRFIYKSFRILYGSFVFYFLPYASIWIPYVAEMARINEAGL